MPATGKNAEYYLESKQHVLEIPDMKTAIEVMKRLNINPKGRGITGKDGAIKLILAEMDKGATVQPESKDTSSGLKKAIENDNRHRARLLSKYSLALRLYKQLPEKFQNDLNQVFNGIEKNFEQKMVDIKKSECTILVVGETGSGKSSVINLLLGVDNLMPTSQLGCTATICELRSNREGKKEAIAYFRSQTDELRTTKGRKRVPVIINLQTEAGIAQLQEAVVEADEDGVSPYDRIEITWPFAVLEEGLVIVDTPGIGGDGQVVKYAEQYLSKSYGFIYVVNSANAGGVQKGRLQHFLRMVTNATGEQKFNSDSTLVVCNKWEMVPENDREWVRNDTYQKLSKYFTDLKETQVHYMSIVQAQKAVGLDTNTTEHSRLMELMEELLPNSLKSRLNVLYRWLSAVIKRAIYILNVSKVMQTKSLEKSKEEFKQLEIQIEKLEQNSKKSLAYMKTTLNLESEEVTKKVLEAMKSPSVLEKLNKWNAEELPVEEKKKMVSDALEKTANKVAMVMNIWERENAIVVGVKDTMVSVCKRDFELMESQISKIEGALLNGNDSLVKDLHTTLKKPAPVKSVWIRAKSRSVDEDTGTYKGLGGVIVGTCTLKSNDKQIKKLFADYRLKDKDKSIAKMKEVTKLYIDNISQNKRLHEKIHKFFSRQVTDIDALAKMIPDFLKADIELMESLKSEVSSTENALNELIPAYLTETYALLGKCDLFFVNYIFRFDYALDDLVWDKDKRPLGKGTFADVYLGHIKATKHTQIPVAMKVCRDVLKEKTVSDILLEDRILRELDHPNIIKYYGATYRFENEEQQLGMQWIMLMELCKCTLRHWFLEKDIYSPGKHALDSTKYHKAMVSMADVCYQLTSGVQYLHMKGFIHRDLKLENILVTEMKTIKVTDVGLTKHVDSLPNSSVGSPVYMAPEVLMTSQNYDNKADIYSLAIIYWEMWYGEDAADYIRHRLSRSLEDSIKAGLRPSLDTPTKPPDQWSNLIKQSWEFEAEKRPTVAQHNSFFEEFLKDSKNA